MALSIKTEEADRLARELARLTGETMTEAVTISLRERLERERAAREADENLPARIKAFSEARRSHYRPGPSTPEEAEDEADWAGGDEIDWANPKQKGRKRTEPNPHPRPQGRSKK